jgi:hypothetical protein
MRLRCRSFGQFHGLEKLHLLVVVKVKKSFAKNRVQRRGFYVESKHSRGTTVHKR